MVVRAADKQYDPKALEARVRDRWTDAKAYEQTRASRAKTGPDWYFIDGPPYATGHIHLGTARNKIIKDAVLRHMTMRGFHVRDQPGYDMHGLPIEVKVEKELGFTTKQDIERFGIDNFVERCRKFAMDHMLMMTEEFKELAVWMDWDQPYLTLDNHYIEGAWWALAKAHERGLLFESERVLSWCWRCETPLANAEVEFEERTDASIYVKFPVKDREDEFLVIWTTTPWTLPANVAVAVHPRLDYARVKAKHEDGSHEFLIVADEQVADVIALGGYAGHEVTSRFKGQELEGLHYEHPFALEVGYHRDPVTDWNNRVILGTHVEGGHTGLVHTATGHGVEDFTVGKQYGIPVFSPVLDDGRYGEAAGSLQGLRVKGAESDDEDADKVIINALRAKGLLLHAAAERHSYGHCWRCKNPIIFRATRQWFIDVTRIQDKLLSEVDRVEWVPDWAGSARQRDWVKNARDWCVSRQRYWGIPLPVWKCGHCEGTHVVSSRKELSQVSGDYREGMDLHRPWIDKITVACGGCGGRMHRVEDVLDVWFDSAVAAWGGLGYPNNQSAFDRWWPGDWICEGLDQTRGWFYSQLGAGVAAFDRVPYESVLMHGWVHDEQGRPMSKSLGNIVQPTDVMAKVGTDAFRFNILAAAAPWDDLSFSIESARNSGRMLNILWNVHVFATQYMAMDGFDPDAFSPEDVRPHLAVEDRWMRSRVAGLSESVTDAFKNYELQRAARAIEHFVLEDLSRWYVRLVRDRSWSESPADTAAKRAAYRTLYDALYTVARLLAPIAPHVTDAMHRDLTGGKGAVTVHMVDWPEPEENARDVALEAQMALVRDLVDAAANARHKANMKLRWPVRRIVVAGPPQTGEAVERFRGLLLEQANAKDIEFVGMEWEGLELVAEPVKGVIGPAFKQDAGNVMDAIRSADARAVSDTLAAEGAALVGPYRVTPEMVRLETRLPDNVLGAQFSGGSLYIDTEVDDDIRGEGYARDVTRRVQEMRKEMGLDVNAVIDTEVAAASDLVALVMPHVEEVARSTRSARVAFPVGAPEEAPGAHVREWDLEGQRVVIRVKPAPEGAGVGERLPDASAPGGPSPEPTAYPEDAPGEANAPGPASGRADSGPTKPTKARKKAAAKKPAKKAATKKSATKKATAKKSTRKKAAAKKPAKKAAAKKSTKKTAGKKSTAKKSTRKKSTAKKATKKSGAKKSTKKSTAKKSAAKKATRKKAATKKPAKKSTAKKSAKKGTAKKSTTRKATAKKGTTRKGTKKSAAKKSGAKKSAAKKPAARKATRKKAAAKKSTAKKATRKGAAKKATRKSGAKKTTRKGGTKKSSKRSRRK